MPCDLQSPSGLLWLSHCIHADFSVGAVELSVVALLLVYYPSHSINVKIPPDTGGEVVEFKGRCASALSRVT